MCGLETEVLLIEREGELTSFLLLLLCRLVERIIHPSAHRILQSRSVIHIRSIRCLILVSFRVCVSIVSGRGRRVVGVLKEGRESSIGWSWSCSS